MSSPETPEETAGQYSVDDDDQLSQEDTLIDRGVDDLLDEGYSPPDKWREPRDNETLDELLSEEEPDPAMQLDDDDESDSEFIEDDEVGDRRAGRLVAPDDGVRTRTRIRTCWRVTSASTEVPHPLKRRPSTSSTTTPSALAETRWGTG